MAKRKSAPRYTQTPAAWYRSYIEQERAELLAGDEFNAHETDKQRKRDEGYFRDSIKLLRKYVAGFEATDGFDLRKIPFITADRIKRIREYAPEIRRQTGGTNQYRVYRPRTRQSWRAAASFTGQNDIPKRKAFVVFTDKPESTVISSVTRKHIVTDKAGRKQKIKRTTIRLTQTFKGGRTESDYFLFADYTDEQFVLFEDMRETIKAMLPHMPKGWYTFMSSEYGKIAAPMRKEQILSEVEQQWMQYDVVDPRGRADNRGLAQTITGLRLVANTLEGAQREYNARYSNAEKMDRWRRQKRAIEKSKAESRLNYEPRHKFTPFKDPRKRRYCSLCGLTKERHSK